MLIDWIDKRPDVTRADVRSRMLGLDVSVWLDGTETENLVGRAATLLSGLVVVQHVPSVPYRHGPPCKKKCEQGSTDKVR